MVNNLGKKKQKTVSFNSLYDQLHANYVRLLHTKDPLAAIFYPSTNEGREKELRTYLTLLEEELRALQKRQIHLELIKLQQQQKQLIAELQANRLLILPGQAEAAHKTMLEKKSLLEHQLGLFKGYQQELALLCTAQIAANQRNQIADLQAMQVQLESHLDSSPLAETSKAVLRTAYSQAIDKERFVDIELAKLQSWMSLNNYGTHNRLMVKFIQDIHKFSLNALELDSLLKEADHSMQTDYTVSEDRLQEIAQALQKQLTNLVDLQNIESMHEKIVVLLPTIENNCDRITHSMELLNTLQAIESRIAQIEVNTDCFNLIENSSDRVFFNIEALITEIELCNSVLSELTVTKPPETPVKKKKSVKTEPIDNNSVPSMNISCEMNNMATLAEINASFDQNAKLTIKHKADALNIKIGMMDAKWQDWWSKILDDAIHTTQSKNETLADHLKYTHQLINFLNDVDFIFSNPVSNDVFPPSLLAYKESFPHQWDAYKLMALKPVSGFQPTLELPFNHPVEGIWRKISNYTVKISVSHPQEVAFINRLTDVLMMCAKEAYYAKQNNEVYDLSYLGNWKLDPMYDVLQKNTSVFGYLLELLAQFTTAFTKFFGISQETDYRKSLFFKPSPASKLMSEFEDSIREIVAPERTLN